MKDSTKHKIEGKVLEMTGRLKEKAGDIANDYDLAAEGVADQAVGKVKQAIGKLEKKIGE